LYCNNLIDNIHHKSLRKHGRNKIIDNKNTTQEQWNKFSEKVNHKLAKTEIKSITNNLLKKLSDNTENSSKTEMVTTEETLDIIWSLFEKCLTTTAFSTLKTKKVRHYNHSSHKNRTHPSEFKKYRKSLTLLKAINKIIKTKKEEDLSQLNQLIQDFNNNNFLSWPIAIHKDIKDITDADWLAWKKEIKEAILPIKEKCIRAENQTRNKQIESAIAQRCINFKENQKKMISSLTNSYKDSICIDRIMVDQEEDNKFITTNPTTIKQQVEDYYTKAFKKRKSNFQQLNDEWKKQYEPRDYINPDWYKSLLESPKDQELNEILKELPTNKAPGPSGITYEMIKKLSAIGKEILKKIFHICILSGKIPKAWKLSNIYPIPKKNNWEARLSNTRPIVLMEATRKCFTKIITNRLSSICKNNQILKEPNFAGLPGESTQEPIQLLNSICEEARTENKELWILLQDTAKAFDTVNLDMLNKALQRIRIPEKICQLIIFLFKERQFKVITDQGLTNTITAGDGID
jgi:hypothetical protein